MLHVGYLFSLKHHSMYHSMSCIFIVSHKIIDGNTALGMLQDSTADNEPVQITDVVKALNVESMVSVKDLFDARVHLGHKRGVWNPLMKPYIKGTRAGLHVIDLDTTLTHMKLALKAVGAIASRHGVIMFVNERVQFDRIVQSAARNCGEYFVTPKWRPGSLTNSYMLLGTLKLPDMIVFLSTIPSKTALTEAAMCNIPTVGIVDTDGNPNLITYPIPGNDDTPSAVELYCKLFSNVILRGKEIAKE